MEHPGSDPARRAAAPEFNIASTAATFPGFLGVKGSAGRKPEPVATNARLAMPAPILVSKPSRFGTKKKPTELKQQLVPGTISRDCTNLERVQRARLCALQSNLARPSKQVVVGS